MDDMFNQSEPGDGPERLRSHNGSPLPSQATPTPIPVSTLPTGLAPLEPDRAPLAPTAPTLPRSDVTLASHPQDEASRSAADMVNGPGAPTQPTARFTLFGIEIRPDAPPADIDRLVSRLGRPKANAAAEDLIRKWSDLTAVRDRRLTFDKVLEVMFVGPDQDVLPSSFRSREVTAKSLLNSGPWLVQNIKGANQRRKATNACLNVTG